MSQEIRLELRPHPSTPPSHQADVSAAIWWAPEGGLELEFTVAAGLLSLVLPDETSDRTSPTDGLWKHSCCEAFLGRKGHSEYLEFNLSPSGAWACYAFEGPRVRSANASNMPPPEIRTFRRQNGFTLHAKIPRLPPQYLLSDLDVGLTTVLEMIFDKTPCLSYWAIAHDAPVPDFHLRSSFAGLLPMSDSPHENRS